jgi:hypothetical protein
MDKSSMNKTIDSKIVATATYSTSGAYDELFRDLRRDEAVSHDRLRDREDSELTPQLAFAEGDVGYLGSLR